MTTIDSVVVWYERSTWLRALVQIPPGGGSVDVLLAGRATAINQRRLEELIQAVNERLDGIEAPNKDFLASEEFFELFRSSAEVAAHSASLEKRQLVADFLSGRIKAGSISDLGAQVLEDLRAMGPTHIQVLSVLPRQPNSEVSKQRPPSELPNMPHVVYEKTMSDLERFGFIRYNTDGIGTYGGGSGHWETTSYIDFFLSHVANQ